MVCCKRPFGSGGDGGGGGGGSYGVSGSDVIAPHQLPTATREDQVQSQPPTSSISALPSDESSAQRKSIRYGPNHYDNWGIDTAQSSRGRFKLACHTCFPSLGSLACDCKLRNSKTTLYVHTQERPRSRNTELGPRMGS